MTFNLFQVLDERNFRRGDTDDTDASCNKTTSTTTTDTEGDVPLQNDTQRDGTVPSERLSDGSISITLWNERLLLSDGERREISDTCAICINLYQAGEKVVWSSNPQCKHVFHAACIEQWLLKERSHCMCPCCRQPFIPDDTPDLEKGTLNLHDTMTHRS